jgi:hypothetical protein
VRVDYDKGLVLVRVTLNRASLVKLSSACITSKVMISASVTRGWIPMAGREGVQVSVHRWPSKGSRLG